MARRGPLIAGMREFDVPRRRTGPVMWVLAAAGIVGAVIILAGLLGGVGPLRMLGEAESPLLPVAWRSTSDPLVLQIAVGVPPSGLCPTDEVRVSGLERPTRLEVSAARTQPRGERGCTGQGITGDRMWVELRLDSPLDGRTVIRAEDKSPLPREGPS